MANFEIGPSDFLENEKKSPSGLPSSRFKVKINSVKRKFLAIMNQKKLELRNERILEQRKKALSNFRIDFMPLCFEEDLEIFASAVSEDQKKNTDKQS